MDEEIKLKVTVDATAAKAEIEALRKELSELGIGEGPSSLGPGVAAGRIDRATTRYEAASSSLGAGLNTRAEESVSLNTGALRAKYADWAGGVPGVTPYMGYGQPMSPVAGLAAAWGAQHVVAGSRAPTTRPDAPFNTGYQPGTSAGALRAEATQAYGRVRPPLQPGLPGPGRAEGIGYDNPERGWVGGGYRGWGGWRGDSFARAQGPLDDPRAQQGLPPPSRPLLGWGGLGQTFDTTISSGRRVDGSPISDEQYRSDWDRNRRLRALDAREPMSPGKGGSFWGALGRGAGFGSQSSLTSRLLLVGAAHETIGGITGAMAAMHEPTELKIQKELRLAQTSAHLHGSLWGLASGFAADAAVGVVGAVGKWALDKQVDASTAASSQGKVPMSGIGAAAIRGLYGTAYGAAHGLEMVGQSGVGKTAGLLLGGAMGSIEAARLAAVNRPAISTGKGLAGKLGEMFGEYAEATGYAMKGQSEAAIIAEQRKVLDPVAALLVDGQRGASLLQDTIKQSVDKAQFDSKYPDQRYRDQRPPVGNDEGASESEQIKEILGKFAAIYDFLPKFEVLFGNMNDKLERAAKAAEDSANKARGGQ